MPGRLGLNKLRALEPAEPVRRYQRERPGELLHIDIKKLGRFERIGHRITGDRTRQSSTQGKRGGKSWGGGWEYVHVAIDDASHMMADRLFFMTSRLFAEPKSTTPGPSRRGGG